MKIILVRHGQAENDTRPDSSRQLTDLGREQAAQTAEFVMTHYQPDQFIVSPYDRAQQTLAAFQACAPTVPFVILDNITPADDAHQVPALRQNLSILPRRRRAVRTDAVLQGRDADGAPGAD